MSEQSDEELGCPSEPSSFAKEGVPSSAFPMRCFSRNTMYMFSLKPWDPKITTNRLPNKNEAEVTEVPAWVQQMLE